MNRAARGVAIALLLSLADSLTGAHATSFNPLAGDERAAPGLAAGATVFLFHGGTGEAQGSSGPGAVLVALRPRMSGRSEPVGRVRVDAAAGALCFRGEVVEGELLPLDLVHAGGASFLVIPTDAPCGRDGAR